MTAEEFAKLSEGTNERRDMQVRQVDNGFVMTYNRRFRDATTDSEKFNLSGEGVAADTDALLGTMQRFFQTGQA